jgi:hypothetical protein
MHLLFGCRCLFSRRRGRRLTPATRNNLRRFCKFRLTDLQRCRIGSSSSRMSAVCAAVARRIRADFGCHTRARISGAVGLYVRSRRFRVRHVRPQIRQRWTLGSFGALTLRSQQQTAACKPITHLVMQLRVPLGRLNNRSAYPLIAMLNVRGPIVSRPLDWFASAVPVLPCLGGIMPRRSGLMRAAGSPALPLLDPGGVLAASNILHGERDSCLAVLCSPFAVLAARFKASELGMKHRNPRSVHRHGRASRSDWPM